MKKVLRVLSLVLVISMLAVSAFADSYVPSIEQKKAMKIKTVTVTLEDGTEVEYSAADVVVTPLAEDEKLSEEDQKLLDEAYDSILDAGSLREAAPKLVDMLEKDENGNEKPEEEKLNVDDFVVRDLMFVQFLNEELKKDGVKVTVQFEMDVDKDEQVLVMRYAPSEEEKDTYEWVPVALDDVTVNEDVTVDVVLDGEGPFAFLVKAEK